MIPIKILFVDDEDDVLGDMERMLSPYHDEWDMRFVDSGEIALEVLEEDSFDLVVSDVQMPGMDGLTLLEEVQRRHPSIVRFVLSDQTAMVETLRSTGVAHQYLTKPCDAEVLRETVKKANTLRQELNSLDIVAAVAGAKSLPSSPELYQKLIRELRSDSHSLAEVGNIVAQDPAMTAKILQLVNSPFFAVRRKVTNINLAVSLLGSGTITALVLTAHVFRGADSGPLAATVDNIRSQSVRVATLARAIRISENGSNADGEEAFLAGILYDCGKLIFVDRWPEEFQELAYEDDIER